MRAADDFRTIRARMDELERDRLAPNKHDGTSCRERRPSSEEIGRVAKEKTRELLDRS